MSEKMVVRVNKPDVFVDKHFVMDFLNIKQTTLYKHINAGHIKRYKFGKKALFSKRDTFELMEKIKRGEFDDDKGY